MKEVVFLTLFVVAMSKRIDLWTMDCAGGFHGLMDEDTDIFAMGMNLGMIKRGMDAVVDIVHERVRCTCPDITDNQLSAAFTPNVETMFNAIEDIKPVEEIPCGGKDVLRFDKLLGGMMEEMGLNHSALIDTCNLNSWKNGAGCAFKIPFPDDISESVSKMLGNDAHLLFASKQCPNSIWPFVSISIEGSFFDYFMNPCDEASPKCGHLSCGRPQQERDEYTCRINPQWSDEYQKTVDVMQCDDGKTSYCDDGYEKITPSDGSTELTCRENSSIPLEFEKELIPFVLHMMNVFKMGAECQDYDKCNIGLKLQNAFMTKANGWMGIKNKNYNAKHVAFCGLPDMMDIVQTEGLRFRRTMSQTVSAVRKVQRLPIRAKQLLSEILGDNSLHGRYLQEEPSKTTVESEDDSEMLAGVMDTINALNIKPWTNTGNTFSEKRVSGDPSLWHKQTNTGTTISLMKKTCSNQYNFLGGHGIGFRSYFMKFPTLLRDVVDVIRPIIRCANPGITESELRSQFLLFEPSFWLKMFGEKHDFHGLDSGVQKFIIKSLFRGKRMTCRKFKSFDSKEVEHRLPYMEQGNETFEPTDYDVNTRCHQDGETEESKNSDTDKDKCGGRNPPRPAVENGTDPSGNQIWIRAKRKFERCDCDEDQEVVNSVEVRVRRCKQIWKERVHYVKPESSDDDKDDDDNKGIEEDQEDKPYDVGLCGKCYEKFDHDTAIYKVECEENWTEGPPHLNFPPTCTLDYFQKTGKCSFHWNYIADLFKYQNMAIGFHMERCPANPEDLSLEISCEGSDCSKAFSLFEVPCSTDADCPNSKCRVFEICDPISDLFSGVDFQFIPSDDGSCNTTGSNCKNPVKFRNDLVKAVMKVHDLPTTVSNGHVGVCEPSLMTNLLDDTLDLETWAEGIIKEDSGTYTLNGLIADPDADMPPATPASPTSAPQSNPVPSKMELFATDCSGGFHSLFHSDALGFGMDLGMLKRALDGVLDIVHSKVKCACPSADDDTVKKAFTPNIETLLSVIEGKAKPNLGTCGEFTDNIKQVPEVFESLLELLDLANSSLPNTCSHANWIEKKECSFKFKLPLPEEVDLGDNHILVIAKPCSDSSIWPYVSVWGEGPVFTHFMKPCHDDSECGGYHCSPVTIQPEKEKCDSHVNPGCPCTECSDDRFPDGEQCASPQVELDVSYFVPELLKQTGIIDEETDEISGCTMCSVTRNIRKKVLGWGRQSIFGDYSRQFMATPFKFCGFDQLMGKSEDAESRGRHRQIMKRISSHLARLGELPLDELLHLPLDQAFDRIQDIFENDWSLPNGRQLLDESSEDEDFEWPLKWSESQAWVADSSYKIADKISGKHYESKFNTVVTKEGSYPLMRMTCDNFMKFGGGTLNKGGYFPPLAAEVMALFEEFVEQTVKCRKSLKDLTLHQIRARFLVFDPSFWLRMFVNPDEKNFGPVARDTYQVIRDALEGEEYDENGEPKSLPKIKLPDSCNLQTFIQTGHCTLSYDVDSDSDITINFDLGRCPSTGGYSMAIDCTGSDCAASYDSFTKPCSLDSDCLKKQKCIELEMCDIVGGLLWDADMETIIGDNCPQKNETECIDTGAFRESLVELMLKINDDKTSTAGGAKGMCADVNIFDMIPTNSSLNSSDLLDELADEDVLSEENGVYNIPRLTSAITYPPITLSPTKTPTKTPTTLSPTRREIITFGPTIPGTTIVTTITSTVSVGLNLGSTQEKLQPGEISSLKNAIETTFTQLLGDGVTVSATVSQNEITRRRRHLLAWATTANVDISSSIEVNEIPSGSTSSGIGAKVNDLVSGAGKDNFANTLKEQAKKEDLVISVEVTEISSEETVTETRASPPSLPPIAPPPASGSGFMSPSILLFAIISVLLQ